MIQRYHLFTVAVLILLSIFMVIGVYVSWWTVDNVLSIVPVFIFTAMIGVILWDVREGFEKRIGKITTAIILTDAEKSEFKEATKSSDDILPALSLLTVHYSQKTDTPDTLFNSTNVRFITHNIPDNSVPRVFLVPNWLKPYIYLHKISFQPHPDENELYKYIAKIYGKDVLPTFEPRPEQIGLLMEGNKINLLRKPDPTDQLTKLKGRKLEDLQVFFLTRKLIHAERVLLLKKSTKEIWLAPVKTKQLIADRIIDDWDNLGMRPWENCNRWSKRQHYIFHPWRYPESELTKGL